MPHDMDGAVHWHEPARGERAGYGKFGQPLSDYDKFMESENIPIFRGIGIRTVRDLELADWPRMGGRGSYIQLHGTEGKWGQYVVEVPGGGAHRAASPGALRLSRQLAHARVLSLFTSAMARATSPPTSTRAGSPSARPDNRSRTRRG